MQVGYDIIIVQFVELQSTSKHKISIWFYLIYLQLNSHWSSTE